MAVMAPLPGVTLAALARLSAVLPLPDAGASTETLARPPDVVVFSSAPMRLLSDLASAGFRQLAALLPIIEQAVQDQSVVPLGRLAKAASAAARQIADGHEALLAEGPDRVAVALRAQAWPQVASAAPNPASDAKQSLRTLARQVGTEAELAEGGRPDERLRTLARQLGAEDPLEPRPALQPGAGPIQRWLAEAKHLLRDTGEVLDRAEQQFRPLLQVQDAAGCPTAAWVLTEINAAQCQIASAYAAVRQTGTTAPRGHRALSRPPTLGNLAGATTVLGMLLVLATLWLLGGAWSLGIGACALGGAVVWVWRISKASQGVTLDARG